MTSSFPSAPDYQPDPDAAPSPWDRAAIKAIQARLLRFFGTQTTAFPAIGGTVVPDMSQGSQLAIVMPAGNITIANALNPLNGDWLTIYIAQDSVGGRTVTWGPAYRKALTLSILPNSLDAVTFRFNNSNNTWNQINGLAIS